MARLIFIAQYLKGGQDKAKLSNRTKYIATREGVELLNEKRDDTPPTKKQQEFISRLLKEFPQSKELGEYDDYCSLPTKSTAGDFIEQVWEEYITPMDEKHNFVDYVSHRPGVKSDGDHGLWDADGKVRNLSKAMEEVANHEGVVWTPVVSIRREDAERLGYTNVENWRALVNACTNEIASGYKIEPSNLRWYAALHEKEKHMHIHLVVFSADPGEGYLTKQGIRNIKSAFATRIFEQDLQQVYERKTVYREELQESFAERMEKLTEKMQNGWLDNERLEALVSELRIRLQSAKGKKVYGYLPPATKRIVDEIVDELSKDERVAKAYSLWNDMREETIKVYTDELPERMPLSRQKEFKTVRNMVIREVLKIDENHNKASSNPAPRVFTPHASAPIITQPSALAISVAVTRMLHNMADIFRDNSTRDNIHKGIQIDRKRRRQLMRKRLAMGHKPDDHEEQIMS